MSAHLRVLPYVSGQKLGQALSAVVVDDTDALTELVGERVIKVRCPNRKCGVVVAAGRRCGSCNHSLDRALVVHACVEDGHRRAS